MNKTEQEEIYQKAISKWGYKAQLVMLMEECAELIQASSKMLRYFGQENKDPFWLCNFVEEMADVEIMIEQFKMMVNNQEEVENVDFIKNMKLSKLKEILYHEERVDEFKWQ